MQYNIPLLRRIQTSIDKHPWQFDQTVQRFRDQDGVRMDLFGWGIELDGNWRFVGDETSRLDGHPFGCAQIQHRTTDAVNYIDQLGPRLLGIYGPEAAFLFGASNKQARLWLDDVLAAHDAKVLDALNAEVAYLDDYYPFGEVTA